MLMSRARPILLLLALAACRSEPPGAGHELPLLDGAHAPDVLTESRRLELPPATVGNRFVKGWNFRRREGVLWLYPRAGARLEAVQLAARPRELVLRTEISDPPPGSRVRVWADRREVGSFALASPLEVPLPADLPLGRFAVDLEFSPEVDVAVDQAGFRRALPAGEVELGEGSIEQSGDSLVDVVRRVPAGTVLAGRFVPPAGAASDQRFTLLVEVPDGSETVFEWRGGLWQRLRGERDFSVALPPTDGLVRVRFLARGTGPAGRWQDLRLRLPAPLSQEEAPAEPPEAPRLVLLYVMDALRADYLGHLGGPEGVSPHLDRLAAEGVTLTRHLSVAPNTLPSTKSIFTGQTYLARGGWKLPSDGPETLAEVFAGAGYRTAVFSGNPNVSATYGTIRGFEHDATREIYRRHTGAPETAYNDSAERVQAAARRWLDGIAASERAFAYVHSLNPHNPYQPPEPFLGRFADNGSTIDASTETLLAIKKRRRPIDGADEDRIRGLYAGSVAYNDLHFRAFLDEIERRYSPGEALVIVTSDHGDELFEHGGVLHGYTLYEDQLQIPLIFWWPTRIEAGRVTAATDNLDLHETLRSLVRAPTSGRGEGRSLWPLLRRSATEPGAARGKEVRFAAASSLKGGIFMARSARYKLIWAPRTGAGWGQGEGRGRSRDPEYLFDLENDPGETVNLAGESSLESAWLRSRLRAWIERGKAIEAGAAEEEVEIDPATRDQLKALGYLD